MRRSRVRFPEVAPYFENPKRGVPLLRRGSEMFLAPHSLFSLSPALGQVIESAAKLQELVSDAVLVSAQLLPSIRDPVIPSCAEYAKQSRCPVSDKLPLRKRWGYRDRG